MSASHVGKIGRLPKCIRDMLGERIEDGEPGKEIVKWLNGLSGVQRVLQEQFGGRPITEQNLSEWKQAGHPEWLRCEEARLHVTRLIEQSDDLEEATDGHEISDRFASVLAAELARLAMTLLEKETDPEKRWQRLCAVHRELSQLRRDDHRAMRIVIKRDRWNREVEREQDEELECEKQANKDRLIDLCFAPLHNQNMAGMFGGGDYGERMAEMLHCIKFDLPLDELLKKTSRGKPCPAPLGENSAKSELIQPNPTKFPNGHTPEPPEESAAAGGESNPVKPLFPEVPSEPDCFQRPVRGGSAVAVLAGRLEQKLAQSCQVRRGDGTATDRPVSNSSMAASRRRGRSVRP